MISGTYVGFRLFMVLRGFYYHGHDHCLASVERGARDMVRGRGCTAFIHFNCRRVFQIGKKDSEAKLTRANEMVKVKLSNVQHLLFIATAGIHFKGNSYTG